MSFFKTLREEFESHAQSIYGNEINFDFDDERESYCYEKTRRAFDLYRIPQTKYAAVCAELESAQGEIGENREQILTLCETIELLERGEL